MIRARVCRWPKDKKTREALVEMIRCASRELEEGPKTVECPECAGWGIRILRAPGGAAAGSEVCKRCDGWGILFLRWR